MQLASMDLPDRWDTWITFGGDAGVRLKNVPSVLVLELATPPRSAGSKKIKPTRNFTLRGGP